MATVVAQDENHKELIERLDELLEAYLGLLHEYSEARDGLSQNLSQGFMSLAKANFTSSNRTRYGADYYDERMQAIRQVVHDESVGAVQVIQRQAKEAEADEEKESEGGSKEEKVAEDDDEQKQSNQQGSKQKDPLKWFGILIPPALRDAQSSFVHAVEDPIPILVNVNAKMEALEIEVRRTKKKLAKLTAASR